MHLSFFMYITHDREMFFLHVLLGPMYNSEIRFQRNGAPSNAVRTVDQPNRLQHYYSMILSEARNNGK